MYVQCEYVTEQLTHDAFSSAYDEAEKLRQLRRAGLLNNARLTEQICQTIAHLGHWMVLFGQKLERLEASPAMPAGAQVAHIENA